MPLVNIFTLDLDLKRKDYIFKPVVTSNDSVRFVINVTDNGTPLDLTNMSSALIGHTRSDGVVVLKAGTKSGVNQVSFDFGSTEISVPGRVDAKVQIFDIDGRVSTLDFGYMVTKDPSGSTHIPSADEQTLIEQVLGDGPQILADAESATINANNAADNANATATNFQTAESTRAAQETIRQTNETTRQNQESQRQTNTANAIVNIEVVRDSFIHLGEYSALITYHENNEVIYNGSTWRCKQTTIGSTPVEGVLWTLVASRGADAGVADGAVTTPKIADGAVTSAKFDPSITIMTTAERDKLAGIEAGATKTATFEIGNIPPTDTTKIWFDTSGT